jgi:hypothetical protein
MHGLTALATNTHRFLQRLQSASIAHHHHACNTNNEQDDTGCDARDGACWMIAESLHLVQDTNDQCDDANHDNGNV